MVPSQRYHLQGLNPWPQRRILQVFRVKIFRKKWMKHETSSETSLGKLGSFTLFFNGYFEYGRTYTCNQKNGVSHRMYEWFQERILLSARIDVTVNYTRKAQWSETYHLIDQGYLGKLKIFTQLNEDHRSSFFFRKSPTPPASTVLCVDVCAV